MLKIMSMRKPSVLQACLFACFLVQVYLSLRGVTTSFLPSPWGGGGCGVVVVVPPDEGKPGDSHSATTTGRGTQQLVVPRRLPTLEEVVSAGGDSATNTSSDCEGSGLRLMEDIVVGDRAGNRHRRIPRVVHVTGRTRCLSGPFADNVDRWKMLPDHSFFFHDDAAVDFLLQQEHWPEFPQLSMLRPCVVSGAGRADLWRYLVLYRYGGIYTDLDNAPGKEFFVGGGDGDDDSNSSNNTNSKNNDNNNTGTVADIIISDDDDSFFVVERIGVLSQYFMAASPGHPLMYLAVLQVFHRLLDVDTVGGQYVPFVTGPGALKNAFIRFMQGGGKGDSSNNNMEEQPNNGYVTAGRYVGHANRSVTVVGTKQTGDRFVHRESISNRDKKNGYDLMGMRHFSQAGRGGEDEDEAAAARKVSCFLTLYNEAEQHDRAGTATAAAVAARPQ